MSFQGHYRIHRISIKFEISGYLLLSLFYVETCVRNPKIKPSKRHRLDNNLSAPYLELWPNDR